jgi:membrane associated rhomboid family serine protease
MASRGGYGFGGYTLTPWVKRLLIANAVLFLITEVLHLPVKQWLEFQPIEIFYRPWTVVTYMFVHGGFWHVFVNMLVLFFFGPPLEERWGSREFLKYYLICGIGGAIFSFIFAFHSAVVGASAAVYGVMLAFAMNWPDVPIYIWGIFPVKAKYLVMVLAAFALFSAYTNSQDGVAHFAHLGGFAVGFLYLKLDFRGNATFTKLKRMISRPRLTVVSGGPTVLTRPAEKTRRVDTRVYDDVDKVLDKISTQGMASLTAEERKLLEDVSNKYRQN